MGRLDLWAQDGLYRRVGRLLPALIAGCVSLGLGAGDAAAADPSQQVLQSFPAPPYTYELVQEACSPARPTDAGVPPACAFGVRLLEGGKPQDRAPLDLPGCGPAEPSSVTVLLGADADAKAWRTREEHCDNEVAARTVDLAPKVTALLVTELMGFEYRYREHWLFLPRNKKLETLWNEGDDIYGTQWTRTTAIAGNAGQDIALIEGSRTTTGVTVRVKARRMHFDSSAERIVSSSLPDEMAPLFVLQVGLLKRVVDAGERQECLNHLVVLRGRLFPGLKLPTFFLGAVFARQADAEAARAALARCSEPPKANVVEYTSSGAKAHAKHH